MIAHVSLGTNNLDKALEFYDSVLGCIGVKRIIDIPNIGAAYGRMNPEFWVQLPCDGQPAGIANGVHFAYHVESIEQVHAFYLAAIEAGATDEGKPGPRSEYSEAYYGCFVRDLDGHKIEAMFWDKSKAPE